MTWFPTQKIVCLIAVATAVGGAVFGGADEASAQFMRSHNPQNLRNFHAQTTTIRRSFKSSKEAVGVFGRVLSAAGLAGVEDRILLRATAEVDAAVAYFDRETNERFIFYNEVFMQELRAKTGQYWSLIGVLAHEIGHHVRFHTEVAGRDHEFELEADYQAGFIMARMGATLKQAMSLYKALPEQATATHPARRERIQLATLGWSDGRKGLNDGVAQQAPQAPAPVQPAPAPPVQAPQAQPPQVAAPAPSMPPSRSTRRGISAMSCDELWYARNEIFARKGHCFKTDRGRRAFGRNCFPPYGRLSRAESRQVSRIVRLERRRGCR